MIFAASGVIFGSMTFGPKISPKITNPRIRNVIAPATVAAINFVSIDKTPLEKLPKALAGIERRNLVEVVVDVNRLCGKPLRNKPLPLEMFGDIIRGFRSDKRL